MKNIVNRALVAKKKQFQSKSVPRGTRTIWRYLGALFILFTFAIGNVLAANITWTCPASADEIAYQQTMSDGQSKFHNKNSATSTSTTTPEKKADDVYGLKTNNSGGFWIIPNEAISKVTITYLCGSTNSADILYKIQTSDYGNNTNSAPSVTFAVKANANKNIWYNAELTIDVAKGKFLYVKFPTNVYISNIVLTPASITKHHVTYKLNGATGTTPTQADVAEGAKFTLHNGITGITTPTNKDFDGWHDGKNKYAGGAEYTMGTSDVELTAQWKDHVAKYTVIYKDGTTELGSETVEVGQHPTGSEIADPTKDCYTFAAWSPALSTVSGTDGATVYVNATWTGNYFTTSVDFEKDGESAVSGIASKNIVASNAGSYDAGKASENWAYKGWKIKSNGATVKVLVQANKKLTYKFGYLAATAHVNITDDNITREVTGASKEEGNSLKYTIYSWIKDYDAVYTFTTGSSGAAVIKALSVEAVYTANFEDEMGVVTTTVVGNVTEVELPTPSETTKSGKNFIGWKADQAVTVGGVAKAANTLLSAGDVAVLSATTTFTAQWVAPENFDVKFYQGYGEPDAQIGDKQTISTGNFAVAPADPTRTGFVFLGWSYDATEAHIVDVAAYGITAATDFTAMWKAVWTVTFDGTGAVNVEDGETVASPDSPTQAGKVFQGWYNGESKYDFSSAVTGNLALTSKWADADANHFYYNYKDDFHFDGVVYKTPEGKTTNPEADEATLNLTTPYILFSGAEGIEEIKVTNGIYDYKKAADTKHVTSYIKINTGGSSKIEFTIAAGYTAVLKMKMGGYSSDPTITLQKGDDVVAATSGEPGGKKASVENNFNEIVYDLEAGTYTMTTATKTLYISHIDLQATALPTYTVTYKPGEGTGDDVEDADATNVADVPSTFTAPTGKVFNGWKDELDNDVEVGTIVSSDMTLTAQWIAVYAVTFNFNGQSGSIAPQSVKNGEKATKPANPVVMGQEFGGWYTDVACSDGNEFDFNTLITEPKELFAKWTAFDGCVELYPATSGEALIVGATVDLQTGSTGGSIMVAGLNGEGTIAYNTKGLSFSNGGNDSVRVTLNNELKNGSVIKLRIMANGATHNKGRGLNLYNAANAKKALLGWQANEEVTSGDVDEFTYTVEEGDGFAGTNIFILQRQNSVFLQSIKVTNCGDAVVYHNLTSEVNIAGKGTVTLGATSVREGHTTTATYSDIDPLYEFVNWTISGTGASIENATANPATITMGTEDAVVTLNLQLIPVKFTVEYYDGATLMGSEQVTVNEYPTASEIVTAKRHYTFLGWSETDGGNVVALNTITRTEAGTVKLYAKYEAVACPTSGTIFSMEFDETKKPGETVTIAKDASIDLAEYATISGGNAMIINGETSGKDAISTDGEFLLKATKEVMKIELNCVLQEGDIIRIPDNSAKLVISTSNAKTGTYQAFADKNTHEFAVTAAWAGVDDIYVLYDGSSLKFTKVYVIRPAKFDVSFNMMGHGTQIADIEDVLEGSKITAPTAPTDEDYSFAGWYKENTLANEWKFDVDVVEANTTLYAKWLDKSDATLKSLKYGAEEIALQAGVYTYNVELPALTTAVPALSAETSNPNATKVITNAAAFDGEGHATSTVVVTPEKVGAATQTYIVNFAKAASVALQDVTGSITWDFNGAVTADVNINNTLTVIANYAGVSLDGADKLEVKGTKFMKSPACVRANKMHFYTTVPGKLTVEYSNTGGSNPVRYLYVNGVKYDETGTESTAKKGEDTKVFVPAGDVELVMMDGSDDSKELNIYRIIFNATSDYPRNVSSNYGTLCVEHNVPAGQYFGATFYQIASRNAEYDYKIDFEEVLPNEELKAGEPYLFKSNTGRIDLFYGAETAANPIPVRGMIGNYAATSLPITEENKNTIYYFAQNKLWLCDNLVGSNLILNEHRAYINLTQVPTYAEYEASKQQQNSAPRRRVSLEMNGEQVATGCENLNASDKPVKMIINGQLFILRGEKMYDAKGQLVK